MTPMNQCVFCGISTGETPSFKVWENKDFIAFLDIAPINPGHLLLIPKAHFEGIFDLPEELFGALFQVAKELAAPLRGAMSAKAVGIAAEGLGVRHAHLHLVPIHNGNDLNPERAQKASDPELLGVQQKLQRIFSDLPQ